MRTFFLQWAKEEAQHQMKKLEKSQNKLATEMFRNAMEGDFRKFKEQFRILVLKYLSSWVLGKSEYVHSAFVFGIFTVLANEERYDIDMEKESGHGRVDMIIEERTLGGRAIIMEFKIAASEEGLHGEALGGLKQIEERVYRAKLHDNIHHLREYGIAFYKKKCSIVGAAYTRGRTGKGGWRGAIL